MTIFAIIAPWPAAPTFSTGLPSLIDHDLRSALNLADRGHVVHRAERIMFGVRWRGRLRDGL